MEHVRVPEVMSVTAACLSFPDIPDPLVDRDNILRLLERMFADGADVVVIEGSEGAGKTTLLAQFALRHAEHTLSVFLDSSSRWASDPERVKFDLANQLSWALYERELSDVSDATDSFLRSCFLVLPKQARKRQEPYYFLIDGLCEMPAEMEQFRKVILSLLPFGFKGTRFVFSGDAGSMVTDLPRSQRVRAMPLPPFIAEETNKLFEGSGANSALVELAHSTFGGAPGHLWSIRRLVESGFPQNDLVENLHKAVPDPFNLEWRSVDVGDRDLVTLLAILAHDRRAHSVGELVGILNIDQSQVMHLLEDLRFIRLDSDRKTVTFVSEAFRRFAAEQLKEWQKPVADLLIEFLMKDPSSDAAESFIPGYLEQAGRFEEILSFLSPERFAVMWQRSQSLNQMRQKAELGIATARKLGRDVDLLRFGIQQSILSELSGVDIWRSEIEARMALGEYSVAITLAHSATLVENRLHLLSIIARKRSERDLPDDPELSVEIQQLFSQIEPQQLGPRAVEIAADLVHSHPGLAINLVEKATSADDVDFALAALSLVASLGIRRSEGLAASTWEAICSHIKDPEAIRLSTEASVLVGDWSASKVIARVDAMLSDPGDKLYLLRQWALRNPNRSDAVQVIEYALDLAIRTTAYFANAKILRELSTPLPSIQDANQARRLVQRLDAQLSTVQSVGPTEDLVRLQLILSRAEAKYDEVAARERLVEAFLHIDELKDLATKTTCLAYFLETVRIVDPTKSLLAHDSLHLWAEGSLLDEIGRLLAATADHLSATKGVVGTLAGTNPRLALEICDLLNMEERRNLALLEVVKSALRMSASELDLPLLAGMLDRFTMPECRDLALLALLERVSRAKGRVPSYLKTVLPLLGRVDALRDLSMRCKAYCLAYEVLGASSEYADLRSSLLERLHRAWKSIDTGWRKIDIGFRIAAQLSSCAPEVAAEYMNRTDALRRTEVSIDNEVAASTYLACVRLAIRSFRGLLPRRINGPEDIARLVDLIDRIPSNAVRAEYLSDLALRLFAHDQVAEGKRIVAERVKPLLEGLSSEVQQYGRAFCAAAPALYLYHRRTTIDGIRSLAQPYRDDAITNIALWLSRKQLLGEPYEGSDWVAPEIDYADLMDICDLLQHVDQDYIIYALVETVADSICSSRRSRARYSRQQKRDIADQLEMVIEARLPDPRNIRHEGWKLVALAQVARIREVGGAEWDDLLAAGYRIPNLADRAYVLSIIASILPPRDMKKRAQVLNDVDSIVGQIPTVYDRANHYWLSAMLVVSVEPDMCRQYLKKAMEFSVQDPSEEVQSLQKRIIDFAYRVNPDLASSLASMVDDDPARLAMRFNVDQQLAVRKVQKQMLKGEEAEDATRRAYARAAWLSLGALNANRANPLRPEQTREYVQYTCSLPITDSYPVFAWATENAIRRFSETAHCIVYLRPMFEAMLLGSELAWRLSLRNSDRLSRTRFLEESSRDASSIPIHPGERDKALRFIREWLATQAKDYLKIADPFFGPEDLTVLQIVNAAAPNCRVHVLTSRKYQEQEGVPSPWKDAYRSQWRLHISDQDPPETEITVVGTRRDGSSPIHDRWWLTEDGGLRLGTSINSLGHGKETEISVMSANAAREMESVVDSYLSRTKREHEGERLDYELFSL